MAKGPHYNPARNDQAGFLYRSRVSSVPVSEKPGAPNEHVDETIDSTFLLHGIHIGDSFVDIYSQNETVRLSQFFPHARKAEFMPDREGDYQHERRGMATLALLHTLHDSLKNEATSDYTVKFGDHHTEEVLGFFRAVGLYEDQTVGNNLDRLVRYASHKGFDTAQWMDK